MRRALVNGPGGLPGEGQVGRRRVREVAVEPVRQVVAHLRLAAVEANPAVHQVVHEFGAGGTCPHADAATPVLFRPPDGVVENLDPIGVPQLDPAVRSADDNVVADDSISDVDERFSGEIRRGLARVPEGHAAVAV
jgi:hypothetical protein